MKRSILPIFIPHLGCPHQCVFCNQRHISWERQPEPEELPALIEAGLPHADRPQIAFYGGSFTAIERSLMTEYLQAAYPYVEDGRADSIRVSTRPDAVDDEIMAILHRYDVRTVELGAQSMDDEVLRRSGRGHEAFDTARAAAMLRDAGFEVILQMMPGLPGSSERSDWETALAFCALEPNAVRIYPTVVIEDTPLCGQYRCGAYTPLTLEEAVDRSARYVELFDRCRIPVVRIGLNPSETLAETVVAGPYHPALGEMVYSRRFLNDMLPLVPKNRPYELIVPPRMLSLAIGQKRVNLERFREVSALRAIRAEADCETPYIRKL